MTAEKARQPVGTEVTRHGPDGARITMERVGVNPTSFFLSGTHGDEWQIIEPLRRVLDEKTHSDPKLFGSHLRVMEAHPHAVEQRNRKAGEIDLNRHFTEKAVLDHPQAKLLADCFLEHKDIHTIFSFHEDVEEDRFYFYYQPVRDDDGAMDPLINIFRQQLITKVASLGVPLYNGVDDIDLGFMVERGFCAVAAEAIHDNTFEMWALQRQWHNHPAIRRSFLFEIPGKLPIEKKEALLRLILDEFVTPYLAKSREENLKKSL